MKKIVLVVAAHPDDELLGVGGTLAKHTAAGDEVYCAILGQGAMARALADLAQIEALKSHARSAGDVIGFKEIFFAGLPDNAFDSLPLLQIVREVEAVITKVHPEIVYTHHEFDLNIDHRLTFQAVLTACRPVNPDCPEVLYTFETLSSTEWQSKESKQFCPTTYVNIEATLEKKIQALLAYTTEMREYPHSRSLEGVRILARFRGLESFLPAAEAFRLIRQIER